MISPTRIAKLLLERVTENEGPHHRGTRSSLREEEIINSLLTMIDNISNCTSYQIESNATLDYDDEEESGDFEEEDADSADESVDPSFDESAEAENMTIKANFSLDYMKKVIEYYDARDSQGRRKHTWKSTQHRFKSVPHRQYITRFRHYIEQHGTKREKLQIIDDFVYDMFEEARDNVLPVHDRDLKRWALQKAAEDSSLIFEASEYWLRVFKHRHRICSRKITKLVTRHHAEDTDAIIESADSFVRDAKRQMQNYTHEEILNTDQIGLELELYSSRTLSYEGEKVTMTRVRSKNATTHSYTVQPMISAAGKLVGPVFLCLKEPKGKMSESKLIYHLSHM
ncbi:unnamed protein product [Rotaria sp. Silwood2]|nr:unnamed protein product [Rotaria sp. Silwood2]CAF3359853.1 unnamed protein product [Rotaria sp. Silwood2]CAF4203471.1 unnamed protein product [Rotaria sp. Silwood2]CAF4297053.1 unnamed protein product [Rotaria sp. Silwood2]